MIFEYHNKSRHQSAKPATLHKDKIVHAAITLCIVSQMQQLQLLVQDTPFSIMYPIDVVLPWAICDSEIKSR